MVKVGENEIFVHDTGGDKPALLLLHGIMLDHSVWKAQVEAFSADYRVVSLDMRGHGRSTTTRPDISFEDHVDDILALIDSLGLRDVTLVGWSMGGSIALLLAANHAEKFTRLVLVSTTPQLLAGTKFKHALPVAAAEQLGKLLFDDFDTACTSFCEMVASESVFVAAQLSEIARKTPTDVALSTFLSSGRRELHSELKRITLPTYIIVGAIDFICTPAASDYMADMIPGCTTGATHIKNAGHAPFLTQTEVFNAELLKALTQN